MGQLRFCVLGALVVADGAGSEVRLPSGPQRRLLSLLLLRSGTVVSIDVLTEHLGITSGALRTAVSRLRSNLGPGVIQTVAPGYRLRTEDSDVSDFERLVRAARDQPDSSRSMLAEALSLWTGRAYDEFADEAWAAAEAHRLEEMRCGAVEDLADQYLASGEFERTIELIEPLVTAQPFRDRPRGQLMRALAGSGREAEAHRAFRRYRTFLLDEVGTEPSAAVIALDRSIAAAQPPGSGRRVAVDTSTVRSLLFTEVESSGRLWEANPSAMAAAIDRHHLLLGEVMRSRGGLVFATHAGSLAAAFPTPDAAVDAAVEAQRRVRGEPWPDPIEIRVRMGIHTGSVWERNGEFLGPTVDVAAQVMGSAVGSQLLVSAGTRNLLDDCELDSGVVVRSSGPRRLRPGTTPLDIFEFVVDGRVADESVEPTVTVPPATLPAMRTALLGRDGALDRVAGLVDRHRLVTVIGPGGCGKSALALAVAHRFAEQHTGRVHYVDLAHADDAHGFASLIARSVFVAPTYDDPISGVVEACTGRDVLLVCDNGEHVTAELASFADRLLDVDGPSILVTSRARLEVVGEAVLRLGPLDGGPPDGLSYATELFIDRAIQGGAELDLSDEGAAEIEELVTRLDRLPFAVELAASAVAFSSPHQLLVDLDRGALIRPTNRSSRRWDTVEEMINWSYELLDPRAQSMLQLMTVTRGWTPLEAVLEVTLPDGGADQAAVMLAELVRLHLVAMSHDDRGGQRYNMLETVRRFATSRIVDPLVVDEARRRHRDWFLSWSGSAPAVERMASLRRAVAIEDQVGNIRAALAFSHAAGEMPSLARQVRAVSSLWWMTWRADEGLRWLEAVESATPDRDLVEHHLSRMACALTAQRWTTWADSRARLELLVDEPKDDVEALALGMVGVSTFDSPDEGLALIDRAIASRPDPSSMCCQILRNFAGELLILRDRFAEAAERYDVLASGVESDPWWQTVGLVNTAMLQLVSRDPEAGSRSARSALMEATSSDLTFAAGGSGAVVAHSLALAIDGDLRAAAALLSDHCSMLRQRSHDVERLGVPLAGVAVLAAMAGEHAVADALGRHLREHTVVIAWQHVLGVHLDRLLAGRTFTPIDTPTTVLEAVASAERFLSGLAV